MSKTISRPAPVNTLTYEVLEHIFMLNAVESNMWFTNNFTPSTPAIWSPLDGARATSQVCRMWRAIMINASVLWGRLLNTTHFQQKTLHWWNEVLRRTKMAPLHFTARDEASRWLVTYPAVNNYVLPLLATCQSRFQKIDLTLELNDEQVKDPRWESLFRLGPSTQVLQLNLTPFPSCFGQGERTISLWRSQVPTQNIRRLSLRSGFYAHDLIGALRELPHLQWLTLKQGRVDHDTIPLPQFELIDLPNLRYLELFDMIYDTIWLLPLIVSGPLCNLNISSKFPSPPPPFVLKAEDLQSFFDALSQYVQKYLALPLENGFEGKTLSLLAASHDILLNISHDDIHERMLGEPDAMFELHLLAETGHSLPEWLTTGIFDAIWACQAAAIKTLEVSWYDLPEMEFPNFVRFMHSLTALEELFIDPSFLKIVTEKMSLLRGSGRILPCLTKVVYGVHPEYSFDFEGKQVIDHLHNFLTWRHDIGVPVVDMRFEYDSIELERWTLDVDSNIVENSDVVEESRE